MQGFLVFFMQAGFAMLEAGAVAPKNAKHILFKNMLGASALVVWSAKSCLAFLFLFLFLFFFCVVRVLCGVRCACAARAARTACGCGGVAFAVRRARACGKRVAARLRAAAPVVGDF